MGSCYWHFSYVFGILMYSFQSVLFAFNTPFITGILKRHSPLYLASRISLLVCPCYIKNNNTHLQRRSLGSSPSLSTFLFYARQNILQTGDVRHSRLYIQESLEVIIRVHPNCRYSLTLTEIYGENEQGENLHTPDYTDIPLRGQERFREDTSEAKLRQPQVKYTLTLTKI